MLEAIKKRIDELERSASIIKRGATVIKLEEARSLQGWADGRLEWFESQINARNSLQVKSSANANVVAELERLKGSYLGNIRSLIPTSSCALSVALTGKITNQWRMPLKQELNRSLNH